MGTTGTLTRAALAAAAVAVAAAGCGADASTSTTAGTTSEAAASSYRGVTRPDPFQVGDVTLPDVTPGQEGTFAFKAPEGALLFVFFGYTNCPDVCPTTMSYYKAALNELGRLVARRYEARFTALVADARGSAAALVELLATSLPYFADIASHHGEQVPILKRAQIAAIDRASTNASTSPHARAAAIAAAASALPSCPA